MSPRPFSNHPTLIEIRAKKARHLELVEEVKLEMQINKPKKLVSTPKKTDNYVPPMSPAGFAMDIRLRKDVKPILKNKKD